MESPLFGRILGERPQSFFTLKSNIYSFGEVIEGQNVSTYISLNHIYWASGTLQASVHCVAKRIREIEYNTRYNIKGEIHNTWQTIQRQSITQVKRQPSITAD
jgi:hypothetical protein